jgi:lysophospholipase L1-like esterase
LKLRRWFTLAFINVVVAVVLLCLVLLVTEVYLRATLPESSGGSLYESTLATKRYKVMKKNVVMTAWGKEFRTNALGFRDRQSAVRKKAAGAFRIIVLGDSFTASAGVDFDHLYTTRLEGELRGEFPNVEVMNLAVGGYNLIQEELVLKEVALALEPDMIVVAAFPFNDLSNDTYTANYNEAMGRSPAAPQPPAYKKLYVYRAYLIRIEARIQSMFAAPPAAAGSGATAADSGPSEAQQNLDALVRMVETAQERGIPLEIVMLPNTDHFEPQRAEMAPFDRLCQARGWRCLNLLDAFVASGHSAASMRLNPLDFHPNERYNELVGRTVAAWIKPTVAAAQGRRQ